MNASAKNAPECWLCGLPIKEGEASVKTPQGPAHVDCFYPVEDTNALGHIVHGD